MLNDQMPYLPEARYATYSARICTPEETLKRVTSFLPRYGITRVSRLTGLDNIGVPVWSAVTPNARSIVIHHGKGITDADAKVSATMEALERAIAGSPSIDTITATQASLELEGRGVDNLAGLIAQGQKLGLLTDLLQLQKQLFNSDTRIIFKKEKSSMKLPNLKLKCKPQNLKKKKAVVHHILFQGNLLPMEPLPSPFKKLGV